MDCGHQPLRFSLTQRTRKQQIPEETEEEREEEEKGVMTPQFTTLNVSHKRVSLT